MDTDKMADRVLIVGAGPVGLMLALILARHQVKSVLLEARPTPTPLDESRAITWMPRALELLDWLHLTDQFRAIGIRRTAHEFWDRQHQLLSIPFDQVDSPHQYTLQLPQHQTERLLEQAAIATGCVEIRRGHHVTAIYQDADVSVAQVTTGAEMYQISAPWAVGADGAKSVVRQMLGLDITWRDYGTFSAVADFELDTDLDPRVSKIVLDPARPYGFFAFAPGRWRFIYRINPGEDRAAMTDASNARALLLDRLPDAAIRRFLWASAFRLRQGQSAAYRRGRWLLAGDAAHPMGPSAGAGMMIGLLGAWRLGWRLALAMRQHPHADALLNDYTHDQRYAAASVQSGNERIFRSIALRNTHVAHARDWVLHSLHHIPQIERRIANTEALVNQNLPAARSADWIEGPCSVRQLGIWKVGQRIPYLRLADGQTTLDLATQTHIVVPIGAPNAAAEQHLTHAVIRHAPVPVAEAVTTADITAPWRVPGATRAAVAVVRPDQHVVGIYQAT